MLGLLPDIVGKAAIDQALAIPLEPNRPSGMPARLPGNAATSVDVQTRAAPRPTLTVPPALLPPAITRPPQPDPNRRATMPTAPLVSAVATSSVAAR